jgi:hypothetical protein
MTLDLDIVAVIALADLVENTDGLAQGRTITRTSTQPEMTAAVMAINRMPRLMASIME